MNRSSAVGNVSSVLLAVALGLIAWFVSSESISPLDDRAGFPEFSPLEIAVEGVPEGYATYDLDVRQLHVDLRGLEDGLDSISRSDLRAYVDLSDIDPEVITATLPIEVDCVGCGRRGVRIADQDALTTTISISPVVTQTRPVTVEFAEGFPAHLRVAGSPASPGQVSLSGAGPVIDRVQRVVALVTAQSEMGDVVPIPGVTVQPLDKNGAVVPDVKMVPADVDVTLHLRGRGTQVSVRPIVSGAAADGFYVTSISVEPQLVQLEGPPGSTTEIATEGTVDASLDIEQATEDVVQLIPLDLPDGVTALNAPDGVTVTVRVSALHGTTKLEVPVLTRDVGSGLAVESVSPRAVDVLVGGPQAQLGDLTADDIEVFVSLSGLGAGSHTLSPRPSVPSGYLWRSVSPSIVEVVLVEAGRATRSTP